MSKKPNSEKKAKKKAKPKVVSISIKNDLKVVKNLLSSLKASDRYELFSGLAVSPFLQNRDSEFENLTVADLVSMETSSLEGKLGELNKEELESFSAIIQSWLDGSQAGAADTLSSRRETSRAHPARFVSTETELRLTGVIAKLKKSGVVEAIGNRTIGEFWSKDGARAPFEEALTIRQILALDIENIIKKRSFFGQKIEAFIDALERCMNSHEEPTQVSSQESGPSPMISRDASLADLPLVDWPVNSSLTPMLEVLYEVAVNQISCAIGLLKTSQNLAGNSFQILKLISVFPELLSPEQFLSLWLIEDEATLGESSRKNGELIRDRLGVSDSQIADSRLSLSNSLKKNAPELFSFWSSVLNTPAVTFEVLKGQYLYPGLKNSFQEMTLAIYLRALGASQPRDLISDTTTFWSFNREGYNDVIQTIISLLPLSDQDVRKKIQAMLPLVPIEKALEQISKFAALDNKKSIWVML